MYFFLLIQYGQEKMRKIAIIMLLTQGNQLALILDSFSTLTISVDSSYIDETKIRTRNV